MNLRLIDPIIPQVCEVFSALGNSTRLKILQALLDESAPASQSTLEKTLGISAVNARRQLACLCRVGLVIRETRAGQVLFSPQLPLVAQICEWMYEQVRAAHLDTFRNMDASQ